VRAISGRRAGGYGLAIVAIFILGAIKTTARNSFFVTLCLLIGYLNDDVMLRLVAITLIKGKRPSAPVVASAIAILVVNVMLIVLGYGWVIALTTAGAVLIDGLILRFQ
jgi:hypothetical protein